MGNRAKEPVTLRSRLMRSGRTSLYLDIYIRGSRTYEYLHLYLIPERTRADRELNRQTMQLAEAVRAKRLVEIRNGQFGFSDRRSGDILFVDYFNSACKIGGRSSVGNWQSCMRHISNYDRGIGGRSMADITPKWVRGFRDYLVGGALDRRWESSAHPLSQNTADNYFGKLSACLNRAYREGVISVNPCRGVEPIRTTESGRMYLTVDEVRRLARTPCRNAGVARAFLFSCLTGLRHSDIVKLTWGEVHRQDGFTRLVFRQRKTGGLEYLDITQQAADLLGEEGNPGDHPFGGSPSTSYVNNMLESWCESAGIDKHITFHCARHTFAVMMLDIGTDIYTVSKLLGHRELSTTQIYAKVLDKNKQRAVASIPKIIE